MGSQRQLWQTLNSNPATLQIRKATIFTGCSSFGSRHCLHAVRHASQAATGSGAAAQSQFGGLLRC